MWKQKICLAVSEQFGISEEEQIRLFKKIGFDGFFLSYELNKDFSNLKKVADEEGMLLQSVHAPFGKMNHVWIESDQTEDSVKELIECLIESKKVGAPIVVMHAFIGFNDHTPTEFGLNNIAKVVDLARNLNIKIAFENTEGEEYLAAIMERFKNEKHVGFCWDTGHEMCYNHSQDLLKLYGDRLFCTHLNDNLGISDYNGVITWTDDLHLLPFDGIADWNDVASRLNKCNFNSELTFELNTKSKPDRHDNDEYDRMDIVDYLTKAYARACKFAATKQSLNVHL